MIYLDNSATTRCSEKAFEAMKKASLEDFGNPSSLHDFGYKSQLMREEAREIIAKTLKCDKKEIYFTSGGTEGNNMALFGGAEAKKRRGNHIITSKIEHASVANPIKQLEKEGFDITYLGTDVNGLVSIDELRAALRPDTIMVSIMMVNNEIGALQPVEEIGKAIKAFNDEILFHVDAIQAYGKYAINLKKLKIDMLTVSGHKIHGPKGSGFIYIRDKVRVLPQILGGGQEKGMRSGTENLPAIAGLGVAAKEAYDNLEENRAHMYALRDRLIEGLKDIEGLSFNGLLDHDTAPHILSVSIKGARTKAEVILHRLEEYGICVSAGSACSSNKPAISETLKAIGLDSDLLNRTIRFSFCPENTYQEIDAAIEAMSTIVPMQIK